MELELKGVTFGYSKDKPVIRDIDLRLNEPGLVCIIGPNGVGKSTLIKCVNKLVTPTEGEILLNGRNINEMDLKEMSKHMGYVPAATWDSFSMPVIDTILVGRHNHQKWRTTDKDLEITHKVMRMLDLEQFSMRGFNELSAGQHQKVAIARGLVQETELLILDEPTSNLDVRHQVYVTELLRAIAVTQDMTILMISHDLNITAKYAHKIIVMSAPGAIYKVGTPDEVITRETIRHVYSVDCDIVQSEGKPHVILKSALEEDRNPSKQEIQDSGSSAS